MNDADGGLVARPDRGRRHQLVPRLRPGQAEELLEVGSWTVDPDDAENCEACARGPWPG